MFLASLARTFYHAVMAPNIKYDHPILSKYSGRFVRIESVERVSFRQALGLLEETDGYGQLTVASLVREALPSGQAKQYDDWLYDNNLTGFGSEPLRYLHNRGFIGDQTPLTLVTTRAGNKTLLLAEKEEIDQILEAAQERIDQYDERFPAWKRRFPVFATGNAVPGYNP